jgi:hypothetical protein
LQKAGLTASLALEHSAEAISAALAGEIATGVAKAANPIRPAMGRYFMSGIPLSVSI